MTPPEAHDDHLAELRRRWEEDPGSRIFLQLAEEYRRAGRHREALEVLERGMESHPRQVSGLVSLGRIHLALERPADAVAALEKAVELDPTNPLAMKLATEAHLMAGDEDMARQRLELYKLLNAGDPEAEALEARVEGREPEAVAPQASPTQAEAIDELAGAAGDGPGESVGGEAAAEAPGRGAWSATAAWPGLPRDGAEEAGTGTTVEPRQAADAVSGGYASDFADRAASPAAAPPAAERPDPFDGLAEGGAERRYLEGLTAEGIFPLELPPEPAPEPEPESEAAPEAAAAAADVTTEEPAGGLPWQLEDHGATPAPTVAAERRPTVTLGQLYLDQGHHAEALEIFDAVLGRDPDNAAATAGRRTATTALQAPAVDAEATADRPAPSAPPAAPAAPSAAPPAAPAAAPSVAAPAFTLPAAELLRDADPAEAPKVALLRAYLRRVRGSRAS